jgi:hypothetical protein
VAAASAGADATFSVGRLGEMIMAIGLVYGHDATTVDERRAAIVTIMGLADGAAVGMSGLAARAGAKGGARVLQRIPTTTPPATAGAGRKAIAKLGNTKGPWSLTALIPYGIGAESAPPGMTLARAVGQAARDFATHSPLRVFGPPGPTPPGGRGARRRDRAAGSRAERRPTPHHSTGSRRHRGRRDHRLRRR